MRTYYQLHLLLPAPDVAQKTTYDVLIRGELLVTFKNESQVHIFVRHQHLDIVRKVDFGTTKVFITKRGNA